ncbi:pyrroloquinoline quinone-dependent dehydrogenase [Falsirhodobacter deserti]|uniref:pyrroloquinoline quinone-dependent dehydrogenase n=1 Tax=Falsirhodobacter deserti TaxID=1365611 RepID=UPI000FE2B7DE|nr:pyrroloquinoline quinone-dependent dehydrogenase [Falsirhodobacter deserti]
MIFKPTLAAALLLSAGPAFAQDAPAQPEQPQVRPAAAQPEVGSDWPFYGGSEGAQRYSPLDQITPENVANLERAFVYPTRDLPEPGARYSPETTPLKVGRSLVMCSAKNILISIDAATGEENWRHDPGVAAQAIPHAAACRGVSTYTEPSLPDGAQCKTRVIEGTLDARLIAVDLETGQPCADFGDNGAVDLWQGIGQKVPGWYAVTAPPTIVRGIVVTGAQVKDGQNRDAPSGVIRGYDAVTGQLVWAWDHGNPDNSQGPAEGETYTRGTSNSWTAGVGDEQLGYVYVPLGTPAIDYYGTGRIDAMNEYSNSLVALDVTTGQPVWHFQATRRDVWDYDLGSQPTLLDYPNAQGDNVPAIMLPTKQGDIYIFDRRTGEPLTPIGEVEAPKDNSVEPEWLADTQPVSLWHTLRKEPKQEKDMWGFTPIDQMMCRIQFRWSNYQGYLTPPSVDKPWIMYPSYNGGSDWGSVSIDPVRRLIIANYNDLPNYDQLIPREEADEMGVKPIYAPHDNESAHKPAGAGRGEGGGSVYPQAEEPYAVRVNAGWRNWGTGVPCAAPPYGGIRAIDLDTGETVWDEPLGTARRNGPFGIKSHIPFTIGLPNNGGSVTTAGGLTFIGAATDNLFRAIDVQTGEVLWQDVLPNGGQANPISYEVDGEQYVLIGASGHSFMETGQGDEIVAYRLKK